MTCAWPRIAEMLLETGWIYGDNCADIAAAITIATGHPVSRCAVIGKADRMGMPRHPLAIAPTPQKPRPPAALAMQLQASR